MWFAVERSWCVPIYRRERLNSLVEFIALGFEFADNAIEVCHAGIVAKKEREASCDVVIELQAAFKVVLSKCSS